MGNWADPKSRATCPIFSAITPSLGKTIPSCAFAIAEKNSNSKNVNAIVLIFEDDGGL